MFTPAIRLQKQAGVSDLPLFKECMFQVYNYGFYGWRGFKKKKDYFEYTFLKKGEWYPDLLDRTTNPFMVTSYGTAPYIENRNNIKKMLKKYKDRLVAFFATECSGNYSSYIRDGKKIGLKKPTIHKQGYKNLKALYNGSMKSRPPANIKKRVPGLNYNKVYQNTFSNWALLYPELKDANWTSCATARCWEHMINSFGHNKLSLIEVGGCIYNTAGQLAFVRGACRQYNIPWGVYHARFRASHFPAPIRLECQLYRYPERYLTPQCRTIERGEMTLGGPRCGVSINEQKRMHYLSYMSGANILFDEGGSHVSWAWYDYKKIAKKDPLVVNLRERKAYFSKSGEMRSWMYDNIMKKHDRGTTYTPIGLVFDKWHGFTQNPGAKVWLNICLDEGDKMMWAVMDTVFRMSKDIFATQVIRNSPYGDIFDVITNRADTKTTSSYKALLLVGKVQIDKSYADKLISYVKDGGVLMINTRQIKNPALFPKNFFGCTLGSKKGRSNAAISYIDNKVVREKNYFNYTKVNSLTGMKIAVTADSKHDPLIILNKYGKGKVILTTPYFMKEQFSRVKMLKLFDNLMTFLSRETFPVEVKTDLQYLVNRNKNGWVVSLFNNYGMTKVPGELPQFDKKATRTVTITIPQKTGNVSKALEWMKSKNIKVQSCSSGCKVKIAVPAGQIRIVELFSK